MKHFIILFGALLPSLLFAQITTKRDSANQIVIVSTVMQSDGSVLTVESAGVDSNTIRDRVFGTLIDTYGTIGRLNDELRELNDQAVQVRNIYAQFDTMSYNSRVASVYASSIYAQYNFRQDGAKKTVDFKANAVGSPIAQTGNTRGNIRLYSPTYIEVKSYFKTKAGVDIDVFLCKKGDSWVTVIDGKKIVLNRKK